jgi:photosystem II stability/assembly factor-like uncharacterized protein
VKIDSDTFSGLGIRSIGPAVMSGRIAAIDGAVEKGRVALYVGSASGGVWKSVNGGTTFKPVFDKYTQSIGAIAIDPGDPKKVWVGTGETWVRNSVSVGAGVYKTVDGGENWEFAGLPDSERIAKIIIDPKNSNTVYACATGHLWNGNAERGVFKTTDGGKTWKKALFVNDDCGCASMAIDPQEPTILYASLWQFRRKAWTFNSGGPGSAIYKSIDGGETWKKVGKGLPEGDLGRIGLAVAPSRANTVYAVVESKDTALYRSDDLGESWTRLNNGPAVSDRPFYYATLFVDPKDYNRVYKPATNLAVSDDGGRIFTSIAGSAHSDFHALWINPENPNQLYAGNDGGLYVSEDRGAYWRFVTNLPLSQFYHISYDMAQPYNVYGGLQDNSSWVGPSNVETGPVLNREWRSVFGGDGFWVFEDPSDADYVYAEYQGGTLARIHRKTLETRSIKPLPRAGEPKFRFNWNAPLHLSQTNKGTVYFGAQFLFRSKDRGDTWERISPDLTTNDPAKQQADSGGLTADNTSAETHTTIYAICESPKNPNVVWAGTDDGNLQLTRDGGKKWENVVKNVTGLPPNTWVSSIEASRFAEGTAYATFDGHTTGNLKTYVYRTTDFGKTWQALATEEITGYAHVIKEDLVNKDLLFLGTEFGLFLSLDGGKQWAPWTGGDFPKVAVRDIAIHPREHDVILATHGRGIWIIDDIRPLRALTPELLAQEAAIISVGERPMKVQGTPEFGFNGDAEFLGVSRNNNVPIIYYQKKRHLLGDLKFEIYDGSGKLLTTIPGSKRRGLNRIDWTMRSTAPRVPPGNEPIREFGIFFGPRVLPGTYTIKMIKNKDTFTAELKLVPDPRSKHSDADRVLQRETSIKYFNLMERLTFEHDRVTALRDQLKTHAEGLPAGDASRKRLEDAVKSINAIRGKLVATKESAGITGEEQLREQIGYLYGSVNGYEGRPTQDQLTRGDVLAKELDAVAAEFDSLVKKDLAAINSLLEKAKLPTAGVMTREAWEQKTGGKK